MTKLEDIDIADYVPRNLRKNYYIWVQDAKKNIKDKVIVILLLFVAEIRLAMFHWFCSYISFCIGKATPHVNSLIYELARLCRILVEASFFCVLASNKAQGQWYFCIFVYF